MAALGASGGLADILFDDNHVAGDSVWYRLNAFGGTETGFPRRVVIRHSTPGARAIEYRAWTMARAAQPLVDVANPGIELKSVTTPRLVVLMALGL